MGAKQINVATGMTASAKVEETVVITRDLADNLVLAAGAIPVAH